MYVPSNVLFGASMHGAVVSTLIDALVRAAGHELTHSLTHSITHYSSHSLTLHDKQDHGRPTEHSIHMSCSHHFFLCKIHHHD